MHILQKLKYFNNLVLKTDMSPEFKFLKYNLTYLYKGKATNTLRKRFSIGSKWMRFQEWVAVLGSEVAGAGIRLGQSSDLAQL